MGFKDKLINKFPSIYIFFKSNTLKEAIDTVKGYYIIKKNNLFDEEYYLKKYKKVKKSKMNPLLHYLFFGFSEGKKPNPYFDSIFYINKYSDAKQSSLNPLVHYSLYGLKEDRKINIDFNEDISNFASDKKKILFITHEKFGALGGTGFTNLDIIESLCEDFQSFILVSTGEEVELWENMNKIAMWNLSYTVVNRDYELLLNENNFEKELFNDNLRNIYEKVLKSLNIDIIHINHLINHSFDLIEVANKLEIPYIVNIHDFYYICPSIHLLNNCYEFCNLNCIKDDWTCNTLKIKNSAHLKNIVETWRKHAYGLLKNSYLNVVSSNSTIDLYKKQYKNLENFKLIEHGRDFEKHESLKEAPNKFPIKIAFPGHLTPHKGSFLIKEIKKYDKDNKLQFHFLGTSIPSLNEFGINHGRYKRDEFYKTIQKINPSFIAILSTCPESYSHTLSEAWNVNVPVIVTNLGALKERVSKTNGGWIVDYKSPKDIYEKIINIYKDKEDYLEKLYSISKIKFRSKKDMKKDYEKIYKEIVDNYV